MWGLYYRPPIVQYSRQAPQTEADEVSLLQTLKEEINLLQTKGKKIKVNNLFCLFAWNPLASRREVKWPHLL